jgi:hypothetical protein
MSAARTVNPFSQNLLAMEVPAPFSEENAVFQRARVKFARNFHA